MAMKLRKRGFQDEDEDEVGTYGMSGENDVEDEDEDEDDAEGPGLRVRCPECQTEMEVRPPKGMRLVDAETGEAVRRGRKRAGEAAKIFHRGFKEAMRNAPPRHFA